MQPPWSEIGRLESDVRDIKSQLNQMARSHEVNQITSDVGSLERSIREISSACNELRHEFETLREEVRQLREEAV